MKRACSVIITLLMFLPAVCQDYKVFNKNNDGYTSVYRTFRRGGEYYAKMIDRYGLIDEKTKKIILPLDYSAVYVSYEPGIYIVKDTMEKTGLFSAAAGRFLAEPDYYEIEGFTNGLAVVKRSKQPYGFSWGAIDKNGSVIIPVEYEFLGHLLDGLMNFEKNDSFGFIDKNNNVVIPAMYGNISNFSNGLAPVKMKGSDKYGYIDKKNNLAIPAQYADAADFSNGYAVVTRKKASVGKNSMNNDAEMALIDSKGKELTGFDYNSISGYMDGGLFVVSKNKKSGVIDSTGKLILPMEYDRVSPAFNKNLVLKTTDNKYGLVDAKGSMILKPEYDYISDLKNNRFYFYKNGKRTVMDQNLKQVIPADSAEMVYLGKNRIIYISSDRTKIFDINGKLLRTINQGNSSPFTSNFVAAEDSFRIKYDASVQLINLVSNSKKSFSYSEAGGFNEDGIFLVRKVKYAFFDAAGKKLNPVDFYSASTFSGGICALQASSSSIPYLADKNFTKIKDLAVSFYGPYSEGIAMAVNSGTKSVVYLDKKGEQVFSVTGKEGGRCTNGIIWIKDNYDYYYFVDKKGKKIGTDSWPSITEFKDGLAAVQTGNKWGFIDSTGTVVIPVQYDVVSVFENGAAVAYKDGKYFMINKKGQQIADKTFDGASNPGNGTFIFSQNKKAGLVDNKGNTIIDFKYMNMMPMSEERVWAAKDGKWGLLDNKGKELTGFIYEAATNFENGYATIQLNKKWGLINKAGKLVLPAEYSSLGSVYKNNVIGILPEGNMTVSLK